MYLLTITNQAPILSIAMPDQLIHLSKFYDYIIPIGTFTDNEKDTLKYVATLFDGTSIPAWLTFDSTSRRLYGTPILPAAVATYNIKITVSDPYNSKVNIFFF